METYETLIYQRLTPNRLAVLSGLAHQQRCYSWRAEFQTELGQSQS
jgi:hypothetical protein